MYQGRSPPKKCKHATGGSNKLLLEDSLLTSSSSSLHSLYSTNSSTVSLMTSSKGAGGASGGGGGVIHPHYGISSRSKRHKKSTWGARERAGMSFLIVIAFFAVFGLIILTEVFMIDDKSPGGMVILRHGNLGNRLGDSVPDYDNVKDDYDILESLANENKQGIFQKNGDNKLKANDRLSAGISNAIGGGGYDGSVAGNVIGNVAAIPWGQVLSTKIEQSLPHYPIGSQPTDGSWQVVNGTRFKFFVFSAYYDRRDGKLVRVIGATKTRGPERVWCRFWYQGKDANNRTKYSSATVMARVKIIRENWNLKYSACFVLCPLRAPGLEPPHSVSVLSRLRAPPGNILLLRNTDNDTDFANRTGPIAEQIPETIGVCVKPFHFNYDQALYLIEYIELYTLLGISHFTFYNHTIGPHATCVLRHYIDGNVPGNLTATDTFDAANLVEKDNGAVPADGKNQPSLDASLTGAPFNGQVKPPKDTTMRYESVYSKPTVEILPWDLRMRSQKEIRTEGLFAALNDCLYRNMYRHKYLALVDLDEFVIPRHNDTLKEMMSWLNQRFRSRNMGNPGAYSFQNAFFYLQFTDDPWLYSTDSRNPAVRGSLITQRKTRRRAKLHPQKQRSKYICKPEAVVEAGNHFVWEFVPGKASLNVPADAAILHHYRVCEFGGDDCIKAPSLVDRASTKYMNRLVDRVETVYNHLKSSCKLDNLPPAPTKAPPPLMERVLGLRSDTHKTSSNSNKKKSPIVKRRKKIVFEANPAGKSQARVEYSN